MSYNSITFLFIFLPVLLIVYFAIPERKRTVRNIILFVFSVLFYAWGDPVYAILLLFVWICNYFLGLDLERRVQKGKTRSARRMIRFGCFFNGLVVCFFGYYDFVVSSLGNLFHAELGAKEIGIPIGITIYGLSAISYLVDVYRQKTASEKNILNLGLYLTMFPRILMGPIVPYEKFRAQVEDRNETIVKIGDGIGRFVIGLVKLTVLAGIAGETWESIAASNPALVTAWLGILAFALKFYFFYSGFSDMAIGLSRIFGFSVAENFQYPYLAHSVSDFWKRWNISITAWFQYYIFRPIQGRRRDGFRLFFGLLITMALMALWYGTSVSFVLGGVFFAIVMGLEQMIYGRRLSRGPRVVQHIYTLIIVAIGWVFFSHTTVAETISYFGNMIGKNGVVNGQTLYYLKTNLIPFVVMILATLPYGRLWKKALLEKYKGMATVVLTIGYILLFVLCIGRIL